MPLFFVFQLNTKIIKYIDITIPIGTTTYTGKLSELGLSGKTVLACQCCNSAGSVCNVTAFTVDTAANSLYMTILNGVQVGNAWVRIVYI